MNNIVRNPLVCGLMGVAIGSGGTLCAERVMDSTNVIQIVSSKSNSNFDLIPYDEDGDVYITEYGKRYHDAGCYTLNNSKEIRKVSSDEAARHGLKPCRKCQ